MKIECTVEELNEMINKIYFKDIPKEFIKLDNKVPELTKKKTGFYVKNTD